MPFALAPLRPGDTIASATPPTFTRLWCCDRSHHILPIHPKHHRPNHPRERLIPSAVASLPERKRLRHLLRLSHPASRSSGSTARVSSKWSTASNCSASAGVEVVAEALGLRAVDHADRALEPRLAQRARRAAHRRAAGSRKSRRSPHPPRGRAPRSCRAGRAHPLALGRPVPVRRRRDGARVGA